MLEITKVRKTNKIAVALLPIGGLFQFEDDVFMKTDEISANNSSLCVDLSTGEILRIFNNHTVTPINHAKLEVSYD